MKGFGATSTDLRMYFAWAAGVDLNASSQECEAMGGQSAKHDAYNRCFSNYGDYIYIYNYVDICNYGDVYRYICNHICIYIYMHIYIHIII